MEAGAVGNSFRIQQKQEQSELTFVTQKRSRIFIMPEFEEDIRLLEEYSRYVKATSGVPDDFDTWVISEYGESRKRAHRIRNNHGKDFDY